MVYVCGPTLYAPVHIGNLRPLMVADLLARFFDANSLKYQYMQSLTDISDKIFAESQKQQTTEARIVKKYETQYFQILSALNFKTPHYFGRPSQYIQNISLYIDALIKKKAAYSVNKNVFYQIEHYPYYGCLSGKIITKNKFTKNPWSHLKADKNDFTLWKPGLADMNQALFFPENCIWTGRPGWHIECSVMGEVLFKMYNRKSIDFCIGGQDLKFPHHENMQAQHWAVYKCDFSKCWINVGQIQLNQHKMAKSTGNLLLAVDFLRSNSADSLKYILLKAAYQKPLNINDSLIIEAKKKVDQWARIVKTSQYQSLKNQQYVSNKYNDYLADNLNMSKAINKINVDCRLFNTLLKTNKDNSEIKKVVDELNYIFRIIGFKFNDYLVNT